MKYVEYLQSIRSNNQNRRGNIRTEKGLDYIPRLRKQFENEENSILKRLADGPMFEAISYNAYAVSGYVFYTADA